MVGVDRKSGIRDQAAGIVRSDRESVQKDAHKRAKDLLGESFVERHGQHQLLPAVPGARGRPLPNDS